ncbi:uncharacterized protein BN800_00633 [Bacteroides sp. CAG:875]|nr:uncharacterized protein BN800_00633 [Bacteroides sp. CAG:875]
MINKTFSNAVIWLRVLMCSLVVFVHTAFIETPAIWPQILHTTIKGVFSCLAVPFFFLVSGYFYFAKLENPFTWKFYKKQSIKRINSLLLPYILWCSLALCSVLVTAFIRYKIGEITYEEFNNYFNISYIIHSFWNLEEGITNVSILGTTNSFSYPLLIPLWFLRDLIIISFLSPIIWYAIKTIDKFFILIITGFYLCMFWQITGLSAQCIYFFSIGAYCSIKGIDISTLCNKFRWITLVISIFIIILFTITTNNNTYAYTFERSLLSIMSLITIIGWSKYVLINKSHIISLSSSAFFIYCFHGMPIYKTSVINFTHKITTQILYPPSLDNIMPCILYFIEGLGNICICFIIYKILRSIFPRLCAQLCGNR